MSVKIEYAQWEDILIHISKVTDEKVAYSCPFCSGKLIAKRGQINRHHFAHDKDADCSASSETILHFNAKHYLQQLCTNKTKQEKVHFEFQLGEHSDLIKRVSSILNGERYDTSLLTILEFYFCMNPQVEYTVGNYRADVFLESERNYGMVFEIFVSHEMEPEKRAFLRENKIPFLELIPIPLKKSGYQFLIHTYFLPNFFTDKVTQTENKLKALFFNEFKDEYQKRERAPFEKKEITQFKLQAVKALQRDIQSVDFYKWLQSKKETKVSTVTTQVYNSVIERKEIFQDIMYFTNKDETRSLKVNDKRYYVAANYQNLLYDVILKLCKTCDISILIGRTYKSTRESVVGFEFNIPDNSSLDETMIETLNATLDGYIKTFEANLKKEI